MNTFDRATTYSSALEHFLQVKISVYDQLSRAGLSLVMLPLKFTGSEVFQAFINKALAKDGAQGPVSGPRDYQLFAEEALRVSSQFGFDGLARIAVAHYLINVRGIVTESYSSLLGRIFEQYPAQLELNGQHSMLAATEQEITGMFEKIESLGSYYERTVLPIAFKSESL